MLYCNNKIFDHDFLTMILHALRDFLCLDRYVKMNKDIWIKKSIYFRVTFREQKYNNESVRDRIVFAMS